MQVIARSIALFVVAGLCEIGGGWFVWQFWREGRGAIFGLVGAVALLLYGVIPTYRRRLLVAFTRRTVVRSSRCLLPGDGSWMAIVQTFRMQPEHRSPSAEWP